MERSCKNCRFMVPHVLGKHGYCHFWPAQAIASNVGTWPPVRIADETITQGEDAIFLFSRDAWCASFKRRPWIKRLLGRFGMTNGR